MKEVTDKPYFEECFGNITIRKFSADVPVGDLVWHKDENNLKVKVISGKGWQFQFDDQLPYDMHEGEIILIPKETYHRVLRGYTDLLIEITECH